MLENNNVFNRINMFLTHLQSIYDFITREKMNYYLNKTLERISK